MSKRTMIRFLAGALLTSATAAQAHHGYAQYDRCKSVSLEGTVESVAWENPHVLVMLKAGDDVVYRIEWQTLGRLAQASVYRDAVKPGDRLVVTGSINKDPAVKIMTLLTDVRRPSDGWSWRDPRPRPSQCG